MPTPAQQGKLHMAIQKDGYYGSSAYDPSALSWFPLYTPNVSFGTVQIEDLMPPEISGRAIPHSPFKSAVWGSGTVSLIPRLSKVFGNLLLAALGAVKSTANTQANGVANTGVHTHRFVYDPYSDYKKPFVSVRRLIPAENPSNNIGETYRDGVIRGLRFIIPQMGKIAVEVAVDTASECLYSDGTGWALAENFEDSLTSPEAGRGYFKMAGVEYSVVNAIIEVVNNFVPMQQQVRVGGFTPVRPTLQNAAVTVNITVDLIDQSLYSKVYTGAENLVGAIWDSLSFIHNTDATNPAFEAHFESPDTIDGAATPKRYGLGFKADKISWRIAGAPQLRASNIVTINLIGTVLGDEVYIGDEYFSCYIENGIAAGEYNAQFTGGGAPVLTWSATNVAYTGTDAVLASAATVTDADSSNFDQGVIILRWNEFGTDAVVNQDYVKVRNQGTGVGNIITDLSNEIWFDVDGTVPNREKIGYYEGGIFPNPLRIVLNSEATVAARVPALLKNIVYGDTEGNTATDTASGTIEVWDGDGGYAGGVWSVLHGA